jgi:hypothetical protein
LAVDQLGVATSDEIEKTAEEIMRGATEIVERLRELATSRRKIKRLGRLARIGLLAENCKGGRIRLDVGGRR